MVQLNPTHSFVQYGGGGGRGLYRILKLQPFLNLKDLSKFSYSSDHHELRLLPDTEKNGRKKRAVKRRDATDRAVSAPSHPICINPWCLALKGTPSYMIYI